MSIEVFLACDSMLVKILGSSLVLRPLAETITTSKQKLYFFFTLTFPFSSAWYCITAINVTLGFNKFSKHKVIHHDQSESCLSVTLLSVVRQQERVSTASRFVRPVSWFLGCTPKKGQFSYPSSDPIIEKLQHCGFLCLKTL